MNKKKITILFSFISYIIFAILYSSKGFALMLAKEATKAHVVYDKYGKSYSYLTFNPISKILYKVGALGMVLTALIFMALVVPAIYREIKILKAVDRKGTYSCESKRSVNREKTKWNRVKKYIQMALIGIICVLVLYSIPSLFENNIFTEVGTEGVYFELF